MRNKNIVILCARSILALFSCGEDRTHEYYELTKENQWIYNTMKDVYLWKENIKTPERSQFFNEFSKFFSSLLSKNDNASFFTDEFSTDNYGMSVTLMRDPIAETPSKVYALVLFVEPGSAAHKAGIRRGTWISAVNNKELTISSESTLLKGEAAKLTTEYIEFDNEENRHFWVKGNTIEIEASAPHTSSNIYLDSIYNVRDKKVGYVVCNSFDGDDFTGKTHATIEKFLENGVTDIVIDLRYNTGGNIANATNLASMLVPSGCTGTPFGTLKDSNEEVDTIYNYSEQPYNVSDKKIYFIIGNNTTGTAELLASSVNASRTMYDVLIIGTASAGVNIMVENIISPYGFSINPAIAYTYCSNSKKLPEEGITPDYSIDELENKTNIHALGEEQEYLLYNAFYIITNGTVPAN